jgi:hypothetical protein
MSKHFVVASATIASAVLLVAALQLTRVEAQPQAQKKINIQNLLDQGYEMKGVFPRDGDAILYFQKGPSLRTCSQRDGGCSSLSLK